MELTYQRLKEVLYLREGETCFRRKIASDDEEADEIAGDLYDDIPGEEIRLIPIDDKLYNDTTLKIFWNTGHYPRYDNPPKSKKIKKKPLSPVTGVTYLKTKNLWRATKFNRHRDSKDVIIFESTELDEAVLARLSYELCHGLAKPNKPRSAYRYAVEKLKLRPPALKRPKYSQKLR